MNHIHSYEDFLSENEDKKTKAEELTDKTREELKKKLGEKGYKKLLSFLGKF
jgi:hypothetical protein